MILENEHLPEFFIVVLSLSNLPRQLHCAHLDMKLPLPSDTFPTLALTPEQKRSIQEAAEMIVHSSIKQYIEHLVVNNSVVDETLWKKIKQREDVTLYRERKTSPHIASRESVRHTSTSNAKGSLRTSSDDFRSMNAMLNFGSIHGNLDDVMYGLLSPNVEEMQLTTAHLQSGIEDWGVLSSIIKPSAENPFRELSIKWSVVGNPPPLNALVRTRDSVYIESTGIALTPNGERIGYHLFHSVDIPEIRELMEFKIVRVKVSICEFFRQRKEDCVEIYARSVLNPMGNVPLFLVDLSAAEVAISVFKYVHCATMKKLTRLLLSSQQAQSHDRTLTASSSRSWSSTRSMQSSSSSRLSSPVTCEVCSQSVSSGLPVITRPNAKQCQICYALVCTRCRVKKTIFLPTETEKQLRSDTMMFCTRCVLTASSASSFKFAALDALASEGTFVDYREVMKE